MIFKKVNMYEKIYKWFMEYEKSFEEKAEDVIKHYIILKKVHTQYVVEVIEQLAKSEGLSEEDVSLAKVIGLLHDVGRFSQIYDYKTDDDSHSINHAIESTRVIDTYDVLKGYDDDTKDIIYKSIGYHNMIAIPRVEKNSRVILFSKLIRDADKVDIYRVLLEDIYTLPKDKLMKLYDHLSFENEVTDVIYDKAMCDTTIDRKDMKTFADKTVEYLVWVMTDINFKESLNIIRKKEYIKMIYQRNDYNEKLEQIYKKVEKYLENVGE